MPGTLLLTHGLPGAGKSTVADTLDRRFPGRVLIAERDRIREAILPANYHASGHSLESELKVTEAQDILIREGLAADKLVAVSDTNLTEDRIRRIVTIAREFGAEVRHVHLDISLAESKRRNQSRADAGGRLVPENIIDDMAAYGYVNGRIKHFSIVDVGSDPGDFEVLIRPFSEVPENQRDSEGPGEEFSQRISNLV